MYLFFLGTSLYRFYSLEGEFVFRRRLSFYFRFQQSLYLGAQLWRYAPDPTR